MKCPYNGFKECLVEKCPSCNYTESKHIVVEGMHPPAISLDKAIANGWAWEAVQTKYEFVSCKLIDNNVPVPDQTNIVHEHNVTNKTAVVVKHGLINL